MELIITLVIIIANKNNFAYIVLYYASETFYKVRCYNSDTQYIIRVSCIPRKFYCLEYIMSEQSEDHANSQMK